MTRKNRIKNFLITGMFFLGLGGWMLHLRIHPLAMDKENFIPFIAGIISVFALPVLFYFRKTLAFAYITNGFLVIIGTIAMAGFSLEHFQGEPTLLNILLTSTLSDIIILWTNFIIGKAVFDLEYLRSEADPAPQGRFFRYPNMGWWWVHLFTVSAVFVLGKLLFK